MSGMTKEKFKKSIIKGLKKMPEEKRKEFLDKLDMPSDFMNAVIEKNKRARLTSLVLFFANITISIITNKKGEINMVVLKMFKNYQKKVGQVTLKVNRILKGSDEELTQEEYKIAKDLGLITSKEELDNYFTK